METQKKIWELLRDKKNYKFILSILFDKYIPIFTVICDTESSSLRKKYLTIEQVEKWYSQSIMTFVWPFMIFPGLSGSIFKVPWHFQFVYDIFVWQDF